MLKISVITATRNCQATIGNCLRSLSNQSYENYEHILIDGASVDDTVSIINNAADSRRLVLSESDSGIYDALNKGISMSSGDVIGFLHADDIYASDDVLLKVSNIFSSNSSVSAVYGDLEYYDGFSGGRRVRSWVSAAYSKNKLEWGWMPPHPTLYVRRDWYERIGGFDTSYQISADYLSVLKLFALPDFEAVYLPEVMVKMSLGGVSNRSLRNIIKKSLEDWRALRSTRVGALGGVGALVWKNLSKLSQFG